MNTAKLARPMKKGSGVRRAVAVLGRTSLESLSTKQLLGRLGRLRFCEESADLSDLTPREIALALGILFKRTPEWRAAYADLKEVLATREHVPRVSVRQPMPSRPSTTSRGSKRGVSHE